MSSAQSYIWIAHLHTAVPEGMSVIDIRTQQRRIFNATHLHRALNLLHGSVSLGHASTGDPVQTRELRLGLQARTGAGRSRLREFVLRAVLQRGIHPCVLLWLLYFDGKVVLRAGRRRSWWWVSWILVREFYFRWSLALGDGPRTWT